MSAVLKAPPMPLKDELVLVVTAGRYPLGNLTLEGEECIRWIAEEGIASQTITDSMIDALNELQGKKKAKSDVLIAKMMTGNMTADELIDWRDLMRASLIDYCSDWARKSIEMQLDAERE
jgi:hypothetical protein